MLARTDLKERIVNFVETSGTLGVTRTHLMQQFRLSTASLDALLAPLLVAGTLKRQRAKSGGLGRPGVRFYGSGVELDLTPDAKPDMPILPFAAVKPRSTPCRNCGVAVPMPERGHPFDFCGEACRRAYRDGGVTVKDLLDRASDPRTAARAALWLVALDLSVRGYQIALDLFGSVTRIIVHDGEGLAYLDVVPVSHDGYFPPPEEFLSAAYVYRDGRIVYTGRQPLVAEEPANAESR